MRFSWLVFVGWLMLTACSECEECEPSVSAPRTSFIFINGKLLAIYNDSLAQTATERTAANTEIDSLTIDNLTLSDSLESIVVLLDSGFIEFREDSMLLEAEIAFNQNQIDSIQLISDSLSTEISNFQAEIDLIESGTILLDTATNLLTGSFLTFEDSAEVYGLPLEISSAEMPYQFSIANRQYLVNLTYETIQELNIEREVVVRALNLGVSSHTFDSLTIVCTTSECFSNEAGVFCFF